MKPNDSQITSFLEQLSSTSSIIKKNKASIVNPSSRALKLKIFHSKQKTRRKYSQDLITLIRSNTDMKTILKALYALSYKNQIDQNQLKRKLVNSFKNVSVREDNKRTVAYKNTEYINNLYQLYRINFDFSE
uniref:Uncharacterized protein n=1 Tax=Chroomonas placoidea TaxID=173977 RepID=A0A222AI20_9CRYP|nr:hypothetical protein [Chroomonas placoidea]ASO76013.1 hypothetical protein [Chroomonas placoidea]